MHGFKPGPSGGPALLLRRPQVGVRQLLQEERGSLAYLSFLSANDVLTGIYLVFGFEVVPLLGRLGGSDLPFHPRLPDDLPYDVTALVSGLMDGQKQDWDGLTATLRGPCFSSP